MVAAPALQIEEVTGSQRSIILRARALPYRNQSWSWSGRQRTNVTWYAGNPVATIQVLGPEEVPSNLEGMWKYRFVPDATNVEVVGFDAPTDPVELVAIFEELRRAGNLLRVQWGPFVRSGVLTEFTATPDRLEDIRWSAEFTWSKKDDEEAPRATAAQRPQSQIRAAQNGIDDENAFRPGQVARDFAASTATRIASIRSLVSEQLDFFRTARQAATVPLATAQGARSAAQSIRTEVEAGRDELAGVPYTAAQVSDSVVDVLTVEKWRRSTSARFRVLASRSLVESRELEREYAPPGFRIVTMPAHGSLRRLALDLYGDGDAWRRLADTNEIKGSTVAPGTLILVPPRGTVVR